MTKLDNILKLEKELMYLSAKYHFETADHNSIYDMITAMIDAEMDDK
jgi:hypothetical protein